MVAGASAPGLAWMGSEEKTSRGTFLPVRGMAVCESLKGTSGEDIYEKVCQTVNGLELDWAKLASVTTDGAPSMVGSKKGVIAFKKQRSTRAQ